MPTPTKFYMALNDSVSKLTEPHISGDGVLTVADIAEFGTPSVDRPIRVCARVEDGRFVIFSVSGTVGDDLIIDSAIEGTVDINLPVDTVISDSFTAGHLTDAYDAINRIENDYVSVTGTYNNPNWLSSLSSSKLTGSISTARLGSGSASASTYLRGDQTWAAIPTPQGVYPVSAYNPPSNGTADDFPAFKNAVDACVAAGGGEVLIDKPLWFTGTQTGTWTSGASNIVFRGKGDSAVITLKNAAALPFNLSNLNILAFVDIVFLGGKALSDPTSDCTAVMHSSAWQCVFERCSFINIQASAAVLSFFSGSLAVRNCKFGGCGSTTGPGVIRAYLGGMLLLDNVHFLDYGGVKGTTYSGRTNPAFPWVWFRGNGTSGNPQSAFSGWMEARNCFFDEGCVYAIDAGKGVGGDPRNRSYIVENCSFNNGQTGALYLAGADIVHVSDSNFGWNPSRPAAVLRDVRYALIERCKNDTGGTVTIDADNTVTTVDRVKNNGLTTAIGYAPTTDGGAINDLVPVQTGNSGKYLTTNGLAVSWGSVTGGGSPGGSAGYVQYKDASGNFAGDPTLIFDDTNKRLGVGDTPLYDLHVKKAGNVEFRLETTGGGSPTMTVFSNASCYATLVRGTDADQAQFSFVTGGTAHWYLGQNPAGTMGTTKDWGLYDVAGASVFRAYYFTGYFNVQQRLGVNESSPGGMVQITCSDPSVIGSIIQGATDQTENLQQWKVGTNVLAYVTAGGVVKAPGFASAVVTKTSAYTITSSDGVILANATSGAFTVTLPDPSSVQIGRHFTVKNIGTSNAVTVSRNGSETIDGANTYSLASQHSTVTVVTDGTNWHIISKF